MFTELETCLVLQQGQLVWSEIEPRVTRLLGEIVIMMTTCYICDDDDDDYYDDYDVLLQGS